MKLFTAVAHSLESYGRMIENIKKGLSPFLCVGLSAIHKANFIYAARQDLNTTLLLLTHGSPHVGDDHVSIFGSLHGGIR